MSRTISRPQNNTSTTSEPSGTRSSTRARTASKTQAAINEDERVQRSKTKKNTAKANRLEQARKAEEDDYMSGDEDTDDVEGRMRSQDRGNEGDKDEDGDSDIGSTHIAHRSISIRDIEESHAPKSRRKVKKRKEAPPPWSSSESESNSPPPVAPGRYRLVPHHKTIPMAVEDVHNGANSDSDNLAPSRPAKSIDQSSTTHHASDKSSKRRKIAPSQNDTTIKIKAVKDIPDETLRNVMFVALRHHSAQVVSHEPYPSPDADKEIVISSFSAAKKDFGALEYKLTKPLQILLNNNKATLRGRVRDAAQHFVPGEYGLGSLMGEALRAEQRRLLRDFAYIYQDDSKRTGPYLRPIVQQVVNRILFSGRHPLAVEYPEYFGEALPTSVLALILTSIHYSISRLSDPTVGKFSGDWSTTYYEHVSRIRIMNEESPDPNRPVMQRICKTLLKHGRDYAKVEKKLVIKPPVVVDKESIKTDAAKLAALLGSDDDD